MPITPAPAGADRDALLDAAANAALIAWQTGQRAALAPDALARKWAELRAALDLVLP